MNCNNCCESRLENGQYIPNSGICSQCLADEDLNSNKYIVSDILKAIKTVDLEYSSAWTDDDWYYFRLIQAVSKTCLEFLEDDCLEKIKHFEDVALIG